jgi:hypothetical protein
MSRPGLPLAERRAFSGREHDQAFVGITCQQRDGLFAIEPFEAQPVLGTTLTEFFELTAGLGVIGSPLGLRGLPSSGIGQQVAELTYGPLADGLDSGRRIGTGKHVVAYQQAIVGRERRTPGFVVVHTSVIGLFLDRCSPLPVNGYGFGGASCICCASAYAVGLSLSLSTNTRPITSTELWGVEICVMPFGTVPFQRGPLRR